MTETNTNLDVNGSKEPTPTSVGDFTYAMTATKQNCRQKRNSQAPIGLGQKPVHQPANLKTKPDSSGLSVRFTHDLRGMRADKRAADTLATYDMDVVLCCQSRRLNSQPQIMRILCALVQYGYRTRL